MPVLYKMWLPLEAVMQLGAAENILNANDLIERVLILREDKTPPEENDYVLIGAIETKYNLISGDLLKLHIVKSLTAKRKLLLKDKELAVKSIDSIINLNTKVG